MHLFNLPPEVQTHLLNGAINFVAAIVILVVGWILAGVFGRWTQRALERMSRFDRTLRPLLVALVRYTIVAITIIAVLNRFGVQTASLIAVLGALGLAIGLAVQGTMSNVASGVMLLILRPFEVGDYIVAGDAGGTVREIGLFRTILITADLVFTSVPNSAIFSTSITNYSREPVRRINFTVRIDYSDDVGKAQSLAMEVLKKDKRVMTEPAPIVPVSGLGDYSVELYVRCWVSNADYWNVFFDLQKAVKERFHEAGVTIPLPQRVITMRNGDTRDAPKGEEPAQTA